MQEFYVSSSYLLQVCCILLLFFLQAPIQVDLTAFIFNFAVLWYKTVVIHSLDHIGFLEIAHATLIHISWSKKLPAQD